MPYVLLALAVLAEVIATSALKATDGFTRPLPSIVVVIGYGIAFYLLALCLRTLGLGFVYAVWSGLGIVLAALAGIVLYGERIDAAGAVGIGLIITGMLVLNFLSRTGGH
ncbi:DMT family transporter [Indioceanicola profundi]|uniref:DMT family transporter n=1 Tax=Indioceanicola profundi TaxID=2220096 RepID=UPI000E6AAA35|nr:multidrug efflux SMR transporter [Indioceanicola profundi]